ncbi:hypothetical protein IED13_28350 [Bosea sp. SSUT16]|uniref:Uncharacterized protein n=1 Tax=Bosea spartocytisi TaxID=2773451 RepID=A0A927EE88_9HYPH|nr:hypothetical protein [Bosea spartocytisi]MBD3849621.1 hypothetical protein [Bosea spartocytisi]
MKRAPHLVMIGMALLGLVPMRAAQAQDASFGCKVLLCAAATAPSWSGIPYCVPVMQDLFRRLAHGGGWPTCPEGNASGLGYEPYQPCPAGMTAAQGGPDGNGGLTPTANGNLCVDFSKPRRVCFGGHGDCSTEYPTTSRAMRSDPYFVDISTANGTQRFYFSLQGY